MDKLGVVKALVSVGADPNQASSRKDTPIEAATDNCKSINFRWSSQNKGREYCDIAAFLIEKGAVMTSKLGTNTVQLIFFGGKIQRTFLRTVHILWIRVLRLHNDYSSIFHTCLKL